MKIDKKGMLLIVSGPSGVGKGTLVEILRKYDPNFKLSCSVTTRDPRPGEIEGVHYHFITDETYDQMLADNAFLEHALVHGNRYGTPRKPVNEMLARGLDVILEIDPQGAISVMENLRPDEYVSVFILPPSYKVLRERLTARNTEEPDVIERRMNNARAEIAKLDRYQYAIINDKICTAFDELLHIVKAEKRRTIRYMPEIPEE
ncbi:MAG: guanylate kinase [Clostridiales bacterium]|nr:guanylate kinase [Clostridiales bacterium]